MSSSSCLAKILEKDAVSRARQCVCLAAATEDRQGSYRNSADPRLARGCVANELRHRKCFFDEFVFRQSVNDRLNIGCFHCPFPFAAASCAQ